jgi:hypothetical protein
MRFLKPLLAGATLVALAAPALASAEPSFGDRGHQYQRDRGDYGYRDRADREFAFRDGWRRDFHGDYGYRWGHRHNWRMEHRRDYRDGW